MRHLYLALLLTLPLHALAADRACKVLERAIEKAPPSNYSIESERLPFQRVRTESAEAGLNQQLTFVAADGASWGGLREQRCEGGAILLSKFTRLTESPDVEAYHPPLPIRIYPLLEGATWDWSGVLTLGTEADPIRLVADASFRVDPETELTVGDKTLRVVPIFHELVVSETVIQTTSWVVPTPPYDLVKEEVVYIDPAGHAERQDTWLRAPEEPR
ncbi:MAG: hypothetical protein JXX28_15245 [Deltaproteobacteria bacterium]|nr:hypothetical protein [Deltaproteobacteria bacterium]